MKFLDYVLVVIVAAVVGAIAGYLTATKQEPPKAEEQVAMQEQPKTEDVAERTEVVKAPQVVGCYTVLDFDDETKRPHLDQFDEFCVWRDGGGALWLYPHDGMGDWETGPIELHQVGMSSNYWFNVTVNVSHTGEDHTPDHKNFKIHFGENTADINGVGASPLTHGGTAHAVL